MIFQKYTAFRNLEWKEEKENMTMSKMEQLLEKGSGWDGRWGDQDLERRLSGGEGGRWRKHLILSSHPAELSFTPQDEKIEQEIDQLEMQMS